MSFVDFVLAGIVLFLAYLGFRRGFIKGIFTLLGLSAGIAVALNIYDKIFELRALQLVTLVVSFFSIFLLLFYLGQLFSRLFRKANLGGIDKLGGMVFGLVKGLLSICFFLVVSISYLPKIHGPLAKSLFVPKILTLFEQVAPSLPKTIKRDYKAGYKEFLKTGAESLGEHQ